MSSNCQLMRRDALTGDCRPRTCATCGWNRAEKERRRSTIRSIGLVRQEDGRRCLVLTDKDEHDVLSRLIAQRLDGADLKMLRGIYKMLR